MNAYAPMQYRRFGKTELAMPVLTCGGMRYQQSWSDIGAKELKREIQENLEGCVRKAVAAGMNHIETARGYGSSEYQLGFVLPTFPRDGIIVQTKVGPAESEDAFLASFEKSLTYLQLDYVDMLAIHGINTPQILAKVLKKGSLAACRKLQEQGLARHVGFSTHGPTDVIVAAIETDEFEYVNLHWFYFDQLNWPAVVEARRHDMGVFIISPNDKGGKLYEPPKKLVGLCEPLTPMGFNDLFCLSHDEVHTLSIGASRPSDYDAHLAILGQLDGADSATEPVVATLRQAARDALGAEWADHWMEGLPMTVNVPEELPVYHILRMWMMAKAFDMVGYGKMRYNLLGSGGHWFPGRKVDAVDWAQLPEALDGYRFADRVPDIMREAHAMFNAEDKKRLSES